MTRALQITDNITFELLYFGFIAGGQKVKHEGSSRLRVRQERDIHRAFRRIAEPAQSDIGYKLRQGGGQLVLEQSEYELVDKYLDSVEWATLKAVEVADMFDLWGSAEKEAAATP